MPVGLVATPLREVRRWMQAASVELIMAWLGMMLSDGKARRIMADAVADRSVSVLGAYGTEKSDLAVASELVSWRAAMAAIDGKCIVNKRACQRLWLKEGNECDPLSRSCTAEGNVGWEENGKEGKKYNKVAEV